MMFHLSYIIFHLTELYSLVILLSLCVQYIDNYNWHSRIMFHLSYIIFGGPSFNRVSEPNYLVTTMFWVYN